MWPWVYAGLLLVVSLTTGLSVVASIACWVVCFGAAALSLIAIAVRSTGVGRPDARLFRSSLHFGIRAWPINTSRFMNFRVDQILMGFLATKAALGIYAVAVSASEALLYFSFAIGSAIVPVIGGSEESTRGAQTLQTLRALLLATAVAIALAAVVGPALLPLVYGPTTAIGHPFLFLLPGRSASPCSRSSAALSSRRPAGPCQRRIPSSPRRRRRSRFRPDSSIRRQWGRGRVEHCLHRSGHTLRSCSSAGPCDALARIRSRAPPTLASWSLWWLGRGTICRDHP